MGGEPARPSTKAPVAGSRFSAGNGAAGWPLRHGCRERGSEVARHRTGLLCVMRLTWSGPAVRVSARQSCAHVRRRPPIYTQKRTCLFGGADWQVSAMPDHLPFRPRLPIPWYCSTDASAEWPRRPAKAHSLPWLLPAKRRSPPSSRKSPRREFTRGSRDASGISSTKLDWRGD